MGVIAIISRAVTTSGGGGGVLPPYSPVGVGIGGIFVAVALVFTLAFYNVLGESSLRDDPKHHLRSTVIAVVLPLFVTFVGIVLYESLEAI